MFNKTPNVVQLLQVIKFIFSLKIRFKSVLVIRVGAFVFYIFHFSWGISIQSEDSDLVFILFQGKFYGMCQKDIVSFVKVTH